MPGLIQQHWLSPMGSNAVPRESRPKLRASEIFEPRGTSSARACMR